MQSQRYVITKHRDKTIKPMVNSDQAHLNLSGKGPGRLIVIQLQMVQDFKNRAIVPLVYAKPNISDHKTQGQDHQTDGEFGSGTPELVGKRPGKADCHTIADGAGLQKSCNRASGLCKAKDM